MEVLLTLGFFGVIGYWIYRSGKRAGSRKGYYVGLLRGRRRSR